MLGIIKDVGMKENSDNHGNDIMKQCNILVYVWSSTSKAEHDF